MAVAARTGDLPSLLGGVIETAIMVAEADFGNIQLLDPNGQLRIVAYRGFPDWWIEYWNTVTIGHGACGSSLALGERVIVEDVEQSPIFAGTPALEIQRKAGVRAVQSTPLRGRSGQVLGMFSTHYRAPHRPDAKALKVIDLLATHAATLIERAQVEAELRSSEERLQRVSDNAEVGLTRLSSDLIYLSANPAYAMLAGMPLEQIVGHSMYEVLGEKGVKTIRPYVERVLRGEHVTYDAEVPFAGSGYRHLHVSYTPDTDADGQITGWVACVTDITQLRVAESQRRAAVVLENTAEGIVFTDANNVIISVNKAFSNITGYSQEEVVGKSPRILKSGMHDKEFYARMWAILHEKGAWRGEILDRRKNGDLFPAWQTISVVRDASGAIANYISVISDISQLKESQERLNFLAYHDPLTKLPNRLLLKDRLQHALQRAERSGSHVAVLFLDVDRFKNINDSLGHAVGDELLCQIGQRLVRLVRTDDTVARLGGDEFVVVMEALDGAADSAILAQKIIRAFEAPYRVKEHTLHVTTSVGISVFPDDATDGPSLTIMVAGTTPEDERDLRVEGVG